MERPSELVELGRVLLREALGSTDSNTMQEVATYIDQMQTGNLTQHSARIGGVHLSTNTQNFTTQPTDAQGYLAMTHVSLSGTDQRSDYSAFAKPDQGQTHGSLHPLQDPSSNRSFALLNAVEAVRNNGQFVMSMLLKHLALKSGVLNYPHAVNPFKFGTHEVKGAAGQDRADFADLTAANTSYLLDLLLDAGGNAVATALQSILERKAKGEDTKDAETAVLVELQKILLGLTAMDTT